MKRKVVIGSEPEISKAVITGHGMKWYAVYIMIRYDGYIRQQHFVKGIKIVTGTQGDC